MILANRDLTTQLSDSTRISYLEMKSENKQQNQWDIFILYKYYKRIRMWYVLSAVEEQSIQ